MKIVSLFNGISCGRLALERINLPVERYVSFEIDKCANQIAKKNYPNDEYYGDVTTADFKQFEGFDLLIGGSPCQGFSVAGKQLNFDDPRSKLFFEFVRALKEINPKYFMLENVKMKKEYQDTISNFLGVEPIEINSALVSAQNRKRLYWTNIPNIEQPQDKGIFLKDVFDENLKHKEIKIKHIETIRFTNNYAQYDQNFRGHNSQDQRYYYSDGKSGTLLVSSSSIPKIISNNKCCLFTPMECERLQTLPDDYTKGIPDTQRYKCIGNGWTVDVIAHILKNLNREA